MGRPTLYTAILSQLLSYALLFFIIIFFFVFSEIWPFLWSLLSLFSSLFRSDSVLSRFFSYPILIFFFCFSMRVIYPSVRRGCISPMSTRLSSRVCVCCLLFSLISTAMAGEKSSSPHTRYRDADSVKKLCYTS